MPRQKRKPGAWTSAEGRAAFADWLRARVAEDGRSVRTIAQAAGVAREALYRILREPGAGMFEPSVRKLAVFFGADPDEIAALGGHPDVRVVPLDPRSFVTIADLLRTSLAARHESGQHASLAAGLSVAVVDRIISRDLKPKRPTLLALASYFRWDPIEVMAFRRKQPGRVAAGIRVAERLGREHMQRIAAIGRPLSHQTPEERREFGRLAGRTTARLHGAELYRSMQTKTVTVMRERGSRWRSDVSRAEYLAKVRGEFGRKRAKLAWETRRERYSKEHIQAVAKTAASPKKKDGPAYQRTVDYFAVGRLWSRVKSSPDTLLKKRISKQVEAQRRYIRQPARRGAPPTLLRDKDLAINAALLHDSLGLSAREIGAMAGFKISKDQRGYHSQARSAWEMIRLGRALRGQRLS